MEYISMVSELNYMSQIVVMLYEDPTKDPFSEERFYKKKIYVIKFITDNLRNVLFSIDFT